ncbi:CMP/dCMP-type deaminase domain-containing protein [Plasmodiophora brassicae]
MTAVVTPLDLGDHHAEDGRFPYLYSILVHTTTHADVHVSLRLANGASAIARPHYSRYAALCDALIARLQTAQCRVVYLPDMKANDVCDSSALSPIGVEFDTPVPVGTVGDWRMRTRDECQEEPQDAVANVSALYFPLLATVIPMWLDMSKVTVDVGPDGTVLRRRKFVYLIAGSGIPRTPGHDYTGNSTFQLARLMEIYLKTFGYPTRDIETIVVDSGPGLFAFSANVRFMQQSLRPLIAAKRAELAAALGEEWPTRFYIMISLKSDTAARTSALMSSLRQFRPDYIHISESKTFWYGWPNVTQLWSSDIEFLDFDSVEASPPSTLSELEPLHLGLVEKMKERRQAFVLALRNDHELRAFWLRKTFKPVLSVLLVMKPGGEPQYFSGMNMEVSMPTGSLCAERNAIGNALAQDPTLHREHFKAMAVLSVSMGSADPSNGDSTSTHHWHTDVASPPNSPTLAADAWDDRRFNIRPTRSQTMRHATTQSVSPYLRALNPINPCGACKEWLKKIALVNPDFVVLTFPSMICDSVFVRPVLR